MIHGIHRIFTNQMVENLISYPSEPMGSKAEKKKIKISPFMIKNKKGFSLLEILVAMALVALIFSMASNFSFTRTQASQELVDDLTIAIEAATDEAAAMPRPDGSLRSKALGFWTSCRHPISSPLNKREV